MASIPGINEEHVRLYGGRFLPLIRDFKRQLGNMRSESEDRPRDPNHEHVIMISSEDESGGDQDDPEDDDDEVLEERSTIKWV